MRDEETFWTVKLLAYLHDPPDKTLKIEEHEERADKIKKGLGISKIPRESDRIVTDADRFVSSLQRISVSIDGAEPVIDFSNRTGEFVWNNKRYVYLEDLPILVHPIEGKEKKLIEKFEKLTNKSVVFTTNNILRAARKIGNIKFSNDKWRFIFVWRFFSPVIQKEMESNKAESNLVKETLSLPADTRTPDHTIWDHLDLSSATAGALWRGEPALIGIKITPVQDFIKNARKAKDLWAGSHLLSMLTFIAIAKIIDEWGPDSVIFPYLRGQPFVDLYLHERYFKDVVKNSELGELINIEIDASRKKAIIANMPNIALAMIGIDPSKEVSEIEEEWAKKIREEINKFLVDVFDYAVDRGLGVGGNIPNTDHYIDQLTNYFQVTVKIIPIDPTMGNGKYGERFKKYIENEIHNKELREKYLKWIEAVENLGTYRVNKLDLYPLAYEILMHLLNVASRLHLQKNAISSRPEGKVEKCTMCGELEAMSLFSDLDLSKIPEIKENEKLCPLCLVKRFYPKYIVERGYNGILLNKVFIESVVDVALRGPVVEAPQKARIVEWYENYNKDALLSRYAKDKYYNREIYFYYPSELSDEEVENLGFDRSKAEDVRIVLKGLVKPPTYYSILIMDGDNMGAILNGDRMKNIEDYIHPKIEDYIAKEKNKYLKQRRLLTPTTHAAFSRSLMNFSVNHLNKIVKKYKGRLVYSGGDDVLAFFPRDCAFLAANEIQSLFSGYKDDDLNLLPGANMSAGLLILHYKYPLYMAMDMVRNLENLAKNLGKNAIAIGYLERSGSYIKVVVSWDRDKDKNEDENKDKNILLSTILSRLYNSILNKGGNSISTRFIYTIYEILMKFGENGDVDEDILYEIFKIQISQHTSGELWIPKKEEFTQVLRMFRCPEDKDTLVCKMLSFLDFLKICTHNLGCRGDAK